MHQGDLVRTFIIGHTNVYETLNIGSTNYSSVLPNTIGIILQISNDWILILFPKICGWVSNKWIDIV